MENTYGPPASIFRIVYTRSLRYGYRLERWNRFAGRWQFDGYERAMNIARTPERIGRGAFVTPVTAR